MNTNDTKPRRTPDDESAPAPGSVRAAIKQQRPFGSRSQEAAVGILLTAEAVRWPFQDFLSERHDLTLQQYNVLRILRGAGRKGLPTLEIPERMVERTPGITRLLDRIEAKGLVTRERSPHDRRQVICHITPAGRDLVRRLDRPIAEMDEAAMAALSAAEIDELIRLLDKVRNRGHISG